MNNDKKERLIDLVRKNECLYSSRSKDYKNLSHKALLWEQIGAKLHIQGAKAKNAWRSLRDGYIRHKKVTKANARATGKYSHFTWSSQMSFLDGTLERRRRSNTEHQSSESPESDQDNSSSLVFKRSPSPVTEPGPSWMYPEVKVISLLPDTQETLQPTSSQILTPEPLTKMDTDMNISKSKKKRRRHAIDHLFRSYAKSFKNLSVRNQSQLKVAIAQLFANAELDDYENDPRRGQGRASEISPATSSSDESTE